jgi:hypothetical protein
MVDKTAFAFEGFPTAKGFRARFTRPRGCHVSFEYNLEVETDEMILHVTSLDYVVAAVEDAFDRLAVTKISIQIKDWSIGLLRLSKREFWSKLIVSFACNVNFQIM